MIALNCNYCKRKYTTEHHDYEEKAQCENCTSALATIAAEIGY